MWKQQGGDRQNGRMALCSAEATGLYSRRLLVYSSQLLSTVLSYCWFFAIPWLGIRRNSSAVFSLGKTQLGKDTEVMEQGSRRGTPLRILLRSNSMTSFLRVKYSLWRPERQQLLVFAFCKPQDFQETSREETLWVMSNVLHFFAHSHILDLIHVLQVTKFVMIGLDVSQMMYHGLGLWKDQSVSYPGVQKG